MAASANSISIQGVALAATIAFLWFGPVANAQNSPPQVVSGSIFFTKEIIDVGVDETHFVVAADLNGDNEMDVVATDFVDGAVFWYENNGEGGFIPRVLDAEVEGAYPAHIADVDGDEDFDVLVGGYVGDLFTWYENNGSGSFTRHEIDTATQGPHSIVVGDVNGDGEFDLITTSQDANDVSWYENDGSENFTKRLIDGQATGAKRAEIADINGDLNMDIVSASFFNDQIAWYENDGNENFTIHVIDDTADGAYFVRPTRFDDDADIDLLAVSQLDDTVAWYENDGDGNFTFHAIDTNSNAPRTVVAVDLDRDGDLDPVVASVEDNSIAWYRNDGEEGLTKLAIDLAAAGAYGVFATDMDRDGDIDVLSAIRDADAVALYRHSRVHVATVELGGTLSIDTSLLQTIDADDDPVGLTYSITRAPASGVLWVDNVPIEQGAGFTQADVDRGALAYVHDGVDGALETFEFEVTDGGEDGVEPAGGRFAIRVTGAQETVVKLPLDEGSGDVAVDAAPPSNNGTLVGGAAFETITRDGSASAVRFDGLNDSIQLGALDGQGSGLTLAAWFNAESFPGAANDPRLISKATGLAADDHVFMLSTIRVGESVRLRGRVRVEGMTTTVVANTADLQPRLWYHAAMVFDGVLVRLFLNGDQVGSANAFGPIDIEPTMSVAVGAQPTGAGVRFFHGLIDDVRILGRALAQEEIAAIVNAVPDCSPGNPNVFAAPGERPIRLLLDKVDGAASLSWSSPADLIGGSGTGYDLLRGPLVDLRARPMGRELDGASCFFNNTLQLTATDGNFLPVDTGNYYLVRAQNECGTGPLGNDSNDVPRNTAAGCP